MTASAAAHEVNDLHPISLLDSDVLPIGAANDLIIPLDSEAFGSEIEVVQQLGDRHPIGNFSFDPVENHTHKHSRT